MSRSSRNYRPTAVCSVWRRSQRVSDIRLSRRPIPISRQVFLQRISPTYLMNTRKRWRASMNMTDSYGLCLTAVFGPPSLSTSRPMLTPAFTRILAIKPTACVLSSPWGTMIRRLVAIWFSPTWTWSLNSLPARSSSFLLRFSVMATYPSLKSSEGRLGHNTRPVAFFDGSTMDFDHGDR